MRVYNDNSKSVGYIVHSRYGIETHIIMTVGGVVCICNPIVDAQCNAVIYSTREEAQQAVTKFYEVISQVVLIGKFERDQTV